MTYTDKDMLDFANWLHNDKVSSEALEDWKRLKKFCDCDSKKVYLDANGNCEVCGKKLNPFHTDTTYYYKGI